MKHYFVIWAIALASCTDNSDRKNDISETDMEDTTDPIGREQDERFCFIRTEGPDSQDTTMARFTVHADRVEGEMNWIPKEKDSRKGTFTGTISDDEITGVWHYMQEGMKDSMTVAFKLSPQQLAQKPFTVNSATGRQETDEAADYTVIYTAADCDD